MSYSGNNETSRKGKGRQKVEMVKIENETNLQVTFSKRRAGLFKKASELSTLCGAETAVVVFSPGNKAHCFGHPNVDVVANRFLNQADVAPMTDADKLVEAHQKATINQHNLELAQIQKELEFEQKRSRELEKERKEAIRLQQRPDIDKLNYRQLEKLKGALLRLRHQLQAKVDNEAGTSARRVGLVDGSHSNSNSTMIDLQVNNPNVQIANHGPTIPYDPTAANDSCPIIPYSSVFSNEH